MHELSVVGVGPGSPDLLTPAAQAVINSAATVVAAPRYAQLVPPAKLLLLKRLENTFDEIERRLKAGSVAVVVSGDPGLFSLLPRLKQRFPEAKLRVIPGIGSLQALCAGLGETWEQARILSGHGRALTPGSLAVAVQQHPTTFLFCDREHNPAWACRALLAYGLTEVQVAVGERLSYPNQRLCCGKPTDLAGQKFDDLSVVRIANPTAEPLPLSLGLTDDQFVRGSTPMTKEEVRWLILCKLQLTPTAIVWDVGAGTGSVAVECARLCPQGEVYAIEQEEEARQLIKQNRERFAVPNLHIRPGTAPAALENLPMPTHVFVGGSGGQLADILHHVRQRGSGITVLVSSVTLTTAAEAANLFQTPSFSEPDIVQLSVCRGKPVGGRHIMTAQNPVTLVRAKTGGDK